MLWTACGMRQRGGVQAPRRGWPYLRCDAHSSQLAQHATDSQEHHVIADGVQGEEELVIIGPSVAKPHELVGAAIRTLPPLRRYGSGLPMWFQELPRGQTELGSPPDSREMG